MIEEDKKYIYANAFYYSILIIFIISIPAYFYVLVEKKSFAQEQMQNLQRYAFGVEKTIYNFSRTNDKVFYFPRSLHYDAALLDSKNKVLFKTTKKAIDTLMCNTLTPNILVKKIHLDTNRLTAKYLLVSKKISYQNIYTKAWISALFIGSVIFILGVFFIRLSLHPLEKANHYLNLFFNDAMHELKTPLGVLQLNLELIDKKDKNKEFQRIRNSVQNIALVYEDVEYFIKHKYVDYRKEKVNFSQLLEERIEPFSDLAAVKHISIETNIEKNVMWEINRIELQRIVDNTLSNAVKYSKKATKIDIKLSKKENSVIFCVKDEGVGIKDTKKIFQRFKREDEITGGFGIGLSIVKHICNKNGIKITVQTELGKGSSFTYTFS
ncbi:sensor histidine kinase [Sulfurimonas sp.]